MKCWLCGIEPLEVIEVVTGGGAWRRSIVHWPPATDHGHSVDPPSPEALERQGHQALRRILET